MIVESAVETSSEIGLVGDIRMQSSSPDEEYLERVLIELQTFMEKHSIDKIDVCWNRSFVQLQTIKGKY